MQLSRALAVLECRIDGTPLALCRIMVGAAALVRGLASYFVMMRVAAPGGVRAQWFEGVPPITAAAVPWLTGIWLLAAFSFLIGFRTRISGAVLTGVIGYYLLSDGSLYANHIYFLFLVVLLMTVADSGATLSVDWYLRGKPKARISYGPVLLLKLQVTIVYLFATIAKLNPAFLSGAVLPEKLPSMPDAWMTPELAIAASWATVMLECYLVFALWVRRLRLSAIVAGVVFHGLIVVLMNFYAGLITYSTTIVATYWVYLSDEEMAAIREPSVPDWRRCGLHRRPGGRTLLCKQPECNNNLWLWCIVQRVKADKTYCYIETLNLGSAFFFVFFTECLAQLSKNSEGRDTRILG